MENRMPVNQPDLGTADFMKNFPSVYTHSIETIYLFLSAQEAEGTVFRKSPESELVTERIFKNQVFTLYVI